ncbi:MAG: hypothetical protein RBS77_00460 [Candidatus Moranbacteria bacterium]|jgi:hypothetical protein|nr:hypothetical protein [Candidatus Moranbacteria bacterium]
MKESVDVGTVYLEERKYQTVNDRRIIFDKLLVAFVKCMESSRKTKICDCQLPPEMTEGMSEMANRLAEVFPKYSLALNFSAEADFLLGDLIDELLRFKEKINGTAKPDDLTYLNHRLEKIVHLYS